MIHRLKWVFNYFCTSKMLDLCVDRSRQLADLPALRTHSRYQAGTVFFSVALGWGRCFVLGLRLVCLFGFFSQPYSNSETFKQFFRPEQIHIIGFNLGAFQVENNLISKTGKSYNPFREFLSLGKVVEYHSCCAICLHM